MAVTLARLNGRGTDRYFKYKTLNKRNPMINGRPNYVQKLAYAMNPPPAGGAGPGTRVRFQNNYTCTAGTFPTVAAPVGVAATGVPAAYAQAVLARPANPKCIRRVPVRGAPAHVHGPSCTLPAFFAGAGPAGAPADWHHSVELRETANMGIGAFASAAIPKDTVVGVYTGDLVQKATLTAEQTSYAAQIRTLPAVAGVAAAAAVQINAYEAGNWTRFVNHSCKPNCGTFKTAMNCGGSMILYVRTSKAIPGGQEITIDYGKDYFRDPNGGRRPRIVGDGCLCGRAGCHSKKRGRR